MGIPLMMKKKNKVQPNEIKVALGTYTSVTQQQ
jgi:hypothetical protein